MEKLKPEPSPVGVKFCGNCNPQVDAGEVFEDIKKTAAAKAPSLQFVPAGCSGLAALLVISGCPRDCAERPPGGIPEVAVAGERVNREHCLPEQIPAAVVDQLLSLLGAG
jgi:hypothetical protein